MGNIHFSGMAINRIGDFDLVIAGRQAVDGDTAQIGPQVAEFLGIPQLTYLRKLFLGRPRCGGTLAGTRL